MKTHDGRPSWWQLYLLGLGMIGLLVLGALGPLSERGHQAAAIGTLLLVWGLVELWLRANTAALLHVSGLVLVPQPGPKGEVQTPDDERQPAPMSQQQPREAGSQRATEGALVLQESDETTC